MEQCLQSGCQTYYFVCRPYHYDGFLRAGRLKVGLRQWEIHSHPKTLWLILSLKRERADCISLSLADSFLKRTQVEREWERDRERFACCRKESVLLAGYAVWASRVVKSWMLMWLFLQLISRLPHHEAVQALQVAPAIMLVTLRPRPEDHQGGVTLNLKREEE